MSQATDHADVVDLTATARRIARRDVSPREVVEATLRRIERLNPILNAYITVLAEAARAEARVAEAEIAAGRYRGPLHGIPVSVKDLFATRGVRTTGGSRLFADAVPDEDATVVRRLREAGAIIVAKANMLELAYAVAHPDYGPTKNPWDLTKTASGSSGGSAAAVVAGLDFGSFGSDTAGSIRIPATFCGATGLKPTFGRVSRHGMLPLSWSLDHAGPLAHSAGDAALLLRAVAGPDPRDPGTRDAPRPAPAADLPAHLDGVTVALVRNAVDSDLDPEIRRAVLDALPIFAEAGATVREIEIPALGRDVADAAMTVILPEATHSHRDWLDARASDYSPTVRERLLMGRNVPAVDYFAAQATGERLRTAMQDVQREADLLLMPTMPVVATPLEETSIAVSQQESGMTALNWLTSPFNLTGPPALSLPCGFTKAGLPIGLQIVGRPNEDELVLRAGHAFQARSDWHRRRPPVLAAEGVEA